MKIFTIAILFLLSCGQDEFATIYIPTLDIDVEITLFPLDGVSWQIAPWEGRVGHFQGTGWGQGNIVLGAHSEYPNGRPGVFSDLHTLELDDTITIVDEHGDEQTFIVTEVRSVAYDDLSVVYPTNDTQLTLITCDEPTYDPNTGDYSHRLVVVAVIDKGDTHGTRNLLDETGARIVRKLPR